MMTPMIERLQDYLRTSASRSYRAFPVPPFTAFLHESNDLTYFNYAIPDHPSPLGGAALPALERLFRHEQRIPRFEFIADYAPDLPDLLANAGYTLESQLPLLLCTPDTLRPLSLPVGFEVVRLRDESPADLLIAHSKVAHIAFSPDTLWDSVWEQSIPAGKRKEIERGMGLFVGILDGEPVCAGSFTVPVSGMTELVGIATLPEHRNKGYAGCLTVAATAQAFAAGVTLAMLTAGDEGAGRVYQRAGYFPGASALAYQIEDAK